MATLFVQYGNQVEGIGIQENLNLFSDKEFIEVKTKEGIRRKYAKAQIIFVQEEPDDYSENQVEAV